MKVYVAGRTEDLERVNRVQKLCTDAGHTITFDWTGPEGDIRPDWRRESVRATELSRRELKAISEADLLVLCGPDPHGGLGCFIETGMAMMIGIDIVVLTPVRESVFWYLPGVQQCEEVELPKMLERLSCISEM